jgi:hypothetical protein
MFDGGPPHQRLTMISQTLRTVWNEYHRLRIGGVLLLGVVPALLAVRMVPQLHDLGPALIVLGGTMMSIAFIGDDLSTIIGRWRTAHWQTLDDLEEFDDENTLSPDAVLARLPDGYAHVDTLRTSSWEHGGKSIAWAFPLGFVGWVSLGALLLSVPVPPSRALGDITAIAIGGLLLIGMLASHELIHGGIARYYGADISYGLWWGGAYCEYSATLLSRRAIVSVTAAPLLILTVVGVLCIISGNGLLYAIGAVLIIWHTPMAGGDLAQLGGYLARPATTYIYPPADNTGIWVFEPVDHQSTPVLARIDDTLAQLSAPLKLP